MDLAWQELTSIQQAGVDAALAAKSKPRKPKQASQPRDSADAPPAANGRPVSSSHEAATAPTATAVVPQPPYAAETESALAAATASAPAAAMQTDAANTSASAHEETAQKDHSRSVQQPTALANGHTAPSASESLAGLSTASAQPQEFREFRENMAANTQHSGQTSQIKQAVSAQDFVDTVRDA